MGWLEQVWWLGGGLVHRSGVLVTKRWWVDWGPHVVWWLAPGVVGGGVVGAGCGGW